MEEWCDRTTLPHSTPTLRRLYLIGVHCCGGVTSFFQKQHPMVKCLYSLVVTNPSNNPKMINPKERMGLIPAMFLEGVKPCSFQPRKKQPNDLLIKKHIFSETNKSLRTKNIYIYIHINIWWLIFIYTIIPIDQHDDSPNKTPCPGSPGSIPEVLRGVHDPRHSLE